MTSAMQIEKLRDDLYEVQSRSSSSKSYFIQNGKEGDYWSCTCTGWATSRNKAGGLGNKGRCAHVTEVERLESRTTAQLSMAKRLMAMKAQL